MTVKNDFIFVRHEGRYIKISFSLILYVEAVKNFVRVHYPDKELLLLITLCQLERELPACFCRVHRSYIVNTVHIQSFDSKSADFARKTVPIARQYKRALPEKMKVVNPENRHLLSVARIDSYELMN